MFILSLKCATMEKSIVISRKQEDLSMKTKVSIIFTFCFVLLNSM